MTGPKLIIPEHLQQKRRYRLGDIDLELSAEIGEGECLASCRAGNREHPSGWNLSAMAVAIATTKELEKRDQRIAELEVRVEQLAALTSELVESVTQEELDETTEELEPDPEELERDYRERLRKAKAKAVTGIGWDRVCERARVNLETTPTSPGREPTPAELRRIEQWLNQNATPRGAL